MQWAGRLALEVDDIGIVLHDQNLAEMEIAMDARAQRPDAGLGEVAHRAL